MIRRYWHRNLHVWSHQAEEKPAQPKTKLTMPPFPSVSPSQWLQVVPHVIMLTNSRGFLLAVEIQRRVVVVPSSWLLLPAASVVPPRASTASSPLEPATGSAARLEKIPTKEREWSQLYAFSTQCHWELVNMCELPIPSVPFDKQVVTKAYWKYLVVLMGGRPQSNEKIAWNATVMASGDLFPTWRFRKGWTLSSFQVEWALLGSRRHHKVWGILNSTTVQSKSRSLSRCPMFHSNGLYDLHLHTVSVFQFQGLLKRFLRSSGQSIPALDCRCLLFLLLRLLFELFGSLFFLWNMVKPWPIGGFNLKERQWLVPIRSPTSNWLRRSTETQAPSGYGSSMVKSHIPTESEVWSLHGGPGAFAQLCLKIPWYLKPQMEGLDNGFPTWKVSPSFFSFFDFFSFSWFSRCKLLVFLVGDGSVHGQVSIAMFSYRRVIERFTFDAGPKHGFLSSLRSEFWPMSIYIYIYAQVHP